ncbi:MAG: bifunctional response regulator/alkaline phosphatase family protein [Bacteroidales bacterium]|jgi:CheY-like chemotaxis protein|nr:bifunctional response regulator/alkaline phosphatase family protein [Bacteroidales bacterium]
MDKRITILWIDDEIDLLKPHILFLQSKGYNVITATNGFDGVDRLKRESIDLIFLDENMSGLSGLETLSELKTVNSMTPVVMITKNEEENIMDQAIGSKITDYLIKPVNPNQILLTIKKITDSSRLVTAQTTSQYQSKFGQLGWNINMAGTFEDWMSIYQQLVYWEMELEHLDDKGMHEILQTQKIDANNNFARFIRNNYSDWFGKQADRKPLMSPNVLRQEVFPMLKKDKVALILIDNLRLDQWYAIAPVIGQFYKPDKESLYCAILPTVTQYARNALFSGLMPLGISQIHPDLWLDEDVEEDSHNLHEQQLLRKQLQRLGLSHSMSYEKIANERQGKKVAENLHDHLNCDLSVFVYNFIDAMSHARTNVDVLRDLSASESGYRSITRSWLEHSSLLDLIRQLAEKKIKIVITTDHGSLSVANPVRVLGDRESSTNLRYKQGRQLNYDSKNIFEVRDPASIHLPKLAMSTSYIFATGYDYMVYPKNYNYYVNFYKNTFQHGGISLEEMMAPIIVLSPSGN